MRKLILAGILLAALAEAQTKTSPNTLKLDDKNAAPKASVSDLAWLTGHWVGSGLGGTTEEIWSPPLGDNMMGVFRVVRDGKVYFYEICTIVEQEGSLVLKLKHFNRDLTGWEEKDVVRAFPLVRLGPNEACFDRITFCKNPDGSLHGYVLVKKRTGEIAEEAFRYTPFDRAAGYKNKSER